MTRVTTKLSNSDIVKKFQQEHEQSRKQNLPTIIVQLASNGKIYPENSPLRAGKIEMRYMTAYEEDILMNLTYIKQGLVVDKLLESLITTPIQTSEIADLDKEWLLVNIRIAAYGSIMRVNVVDPNTNAVLERDVDLTKIRCTPFLLEPDSQGEFSYEVDGFSIKFKYIDLNKITSDIATPTMVLKRYLTEINGERSPERIDEILKYELWAKTAKSIRDYIQNHVPTIDSSYEFTGEDGGTFTATFPVFGANFWS
jgi:hypothetical protein